MTSFPKNWNVMEKNKKKTPPVMEKNISACRHPPQYIAGFVKSLYASRKTGTFPFSFPNRSLQGHEGLGASKNY